MFVFCFCNIYTRLLSLESAFSDVWERRIWKGKCDLFGGYFAVAKLHFVNFRHVEGAIKIPMSLNYHHVKVFCELPSAIKFQRFKLSPCQLFLWISKCHKNSNAFKWSPCQGFLWTSKWSTPATTQLLILLVWSSQRWLKSFRWLW